MLKQVLIVLLSVLMTTSLLAQEGGIQFTTAKWKEILATAKKENKLIFMDAYTTWCGPCKKMSKKIFPQKKVGDFYNKKFINVKMNMEKGEGVQLGDQYGVIAYPTLLFISSDGTLIHRVAGYHNEREFLDLAQVALDPTRNLSALEKRYARGDRNADFLMNYAVRRAEAMDDSHGPIAQEYLNTQNDWSAPHNLDFIFRFCENADSELFNYMVANRATFVERFGEKQALGKIENLVYNKLSDANNITLDDAEMLFKRAYPEKAKELSSKYRMTYYRQRGNREGFANAAIDHYTKFPSTDSDELNDTAWTFYEVVENKDHLKDAIKLTKQSIKLQKGYFNMDTLAALYYKLGKKRKALKTAKKAIALAKANKEDYSLTTQLMQDIKKM